MASLMVPKEFYMASSMKRVSSHCFTYESHRHLWQLHCPRWRDDIPANTILICPQTMIWTSCKQTFTWIMLLMIIHRLQDTLMRRSSWNAMQESRNLQLDCFSWKPSGPRSLRNLLSLPNFDYFTRSPGRHTLPDHWEDKSYQRAGWEEMSEAADDAKIQEELGKNGNRNEDNCLAVLPKQHLSGRESKSRLNASFSI